MKSSTHTSNEKEALYMNVLAWLTFSIPFLIPPHPK